VSESAVETHKIRFFDLHGELSDASQEPNVEDRALLVDSILHDLYVTGAAWSQSGHMARMTGNEDREVFLQPSVGGPTTTGDTFFEVQIFPDNYELDGFRYYLSPDETVFRLPQCYGIRIKKSENPYILMTMSECTAIVGETDDDIYAIHVGMSERDAIKKYLQLLEDRGVSRQRTYAVASVGEPQYQAQKLEWYDYTKIEDVSELTAQGVPEENIIPFKYIENGRHQMLTGVVVTKDYLSQYYFEESDKASMHDPVTLPFKAEEEM
jgi:hypothetical protein